MAAMAFRRGSATTVAIASAVLLAGCTGAPNADGPLQVPDPHGMTTAAADVGQVFTDGFEMLVVEGDEPITIRDVSLVGADPQLELVDAVVAAEERTLNFAYDPAFPPAEMDLGPLSAAEGMVLYPRSQQRIGTDGFTDYELLLGIRITEPGVWKRTGVRILYEVGDREYAWNSPAELIACTKDHSEDGVSCPSKIE